MANLGFAMLGLPDVLPPSQRPKGLHALAHLFDHAGPFGPFSGGDPLQPEAFRFDAHLIQQPSPEGDATHHLVVALLVVAVAGVTARPQHAIRPLTAGLA